MRKALNTLIKQVDYEVEMIRNLITGQALYDSNLFDLVGSFPVNSTENQMKTDTNCLKGRKGVYLFVANRSFDVSREQILSWNTEAYAPLNSFDIHGNVISATVNNGDVFYLGSCYSKSGSLLSRLRDHCNYASDKSSLKLENAKRQWVKQYLVAYYFAIDKIYTDEEKRIILPAIERQLHISFQHIAGGKRT